MNNEPLPQPLGGSKSSGPAASPVRSGAKPGSGVGGIDSAIAEIDQQETGKARTRQTPQPRPADPKRLGTREDALEQYDYDQPKKKRRWWGHVVRFLGWILLIVLLTGAGAAAGWYFWLRKEPKTAQTAMVDQTGAGQSGASATADDVDKAKEETEPTETFSSAPFNLQFDYPQTWKASEGTDNKVTSVSPAMKLKLASGKTQTGQIVVTFQHKQISLPEFKTGNSLAVLESQKIDYAKPSQVQRASTYLSFLNYNDSVSKGVTGIDGVYVTGDYGYVKNQYIPQENVTKSDPLITVTFRACSDSACTVSGEAVTVAASAWSEESLSKPVVTLLKSIVVQ